MRKCGKCANQSECFIRKSAHILYDHTSFVSVRASLKESLNFRNQIPPILVVACPSWGRPKAPFEPTQSRLGAE